MIDFRAVVCRKVGRKTSCLYTHASFFSRQKATAWPHEQFAPHPYLLLQKRESAELTLCKEGISQEDPAVRSSSNIAASRCSPYRCKQNHNILQLSCPRATGSCLVWLWRVFLAFDECGEGREPFSPFPDAPSQEAKGSSIMSLSSLAAYLRSDKLRELATIFRALRLLRSHMASQVTTTMDARDPSNSLRPVLLSQPRKLCTFAHASRRKLVANA